MNRKSLVDWMRVGTGESMKKAGKGVSQYSTDFFPCLGVGIYNLKTDESYMAHYTDLFFYDLEEDLNLIKNDFGNSSLIISTAGGALDSSESSFYNNIILEDRKRIEDALIKNFPNSEISFNWNNSEKFIDFYLDKSKKEFSIESD